MTRRHLLLTAPAAALTAAPANRYAFLAGVGAYAYRHNITPLEGPPHDVAAVQSRLFTLHGFSKNNIVTLVNQDATRDAILKQLRSLAARLRPGDYLHFYFSGHGSRPHDGHRLLTPDTGALVPHDFDGNAETLILGKRDLRPIWEDLDTRGVTVFGLLDSCYSANSMRSLDGGPSVLVSRFADIAPPGANASATPPSTSPLRNLLWISAASTNQSADEIGSRGAHLTIDGRPHGVMTNTLLHGLDRGGLLTHRDLFAFLKLHAKHWNHSPQWRSHPSADLGSLPLFGASGTPGYRPARRVRMIGVSGDVLKGLPVEPVNEPATDAANVVLERESTGMYFVYPPSQKPFKPRALDEITARIKLLPAPPVRVVFGRDVPPEIAAGLDEVEVVPAQGDLFLASVPGGFQLYWPSGLAFRQSPYTQDQVATRLAREPHLRRLDAFPSTSGHYLDLEVRVEGEPSARRTFFAGERLTLHARLNTAAYLLIVNFDPDGAGTVLFPHNESHLTPTVGHSLGSLKVDPPFGTDQLHAFAFASRPPRHDRWLRLSPPSASEMLQFLIEAGGPTAHHALSVTTANR